MKWRCEWCGKPHEEDDPPCDNCGHGSFEKAIVREPSYETVDTGPTYVWACPNCDREHVKNSPPCSRCGNPDLEKVEQDYADVERDLETPSWLEVAKPYAPVFLVAAVVIALFATGIVPLSAIPGLGTPDPPEAPDAPGNGSEAAGIDLEAVELAVHDQLEAERSAASREYDDGLAAFAEFRNRQLVVAADEGVEPDDMPPLNAFDPTCGEETPTGGSVTLGDPIDAYDDEPELATAIAVAIQSESAIEGGSSFVAEGLDVHVADDTVFVYYLTC